MRIVIIVLLFLPLLASAGPGGTVFKYECGQIDPAVTHFECKFTDRLYLRLLKKKTDLTPAQRKRADYEFERIALRYISLGGRHFEVTATFGPQDLKKICFARKNRKSYYCTYCTEKNGICESK